MQRKILKAFDNSLLNYMIVILYKNAISQESLIGKIHKKK